MRLTLAIVLVLTTASARAATFTVTSTLDTDDAKPGDGVCADAAGNCTLRAALTEANATAGATVQFNLPGAGVHTFKPASRLPPITGPLTLDARTQPGYAGTPLVEIDGSALPTTSASWGLSAGTNVSISGFSVYGAPQTGISVDGAGCKVFASYVGLTAGGVEKPNAVGVFVTTSSGAASVIGGKTAAERNVISGNTTNVSLGSGAQVIGNYIGTDATGASAIDAAQTGVLLTGLHATVANNLIAGLKYGVLVSGLPSGAPLMNTIDGNLIGTDASGSKAIANDEAVRLDGVGNTVSRNTISGNNYGIYFGSTSSASNSIVGNYIGTTSAGTGALGNGVGVYVGDLANGNTIGDPTGAARNIISGNTTGVAVQNGASNSNTVAGNVIGLDVNGAVLGNTKYGVDFPNGGKGIVGGSGGARNIISGNGSAGVHVAGDARGPIAILGNYIGTDAAGVAARPNGVGVALENAFEVVVGDGSTGGANLISGNSGAGVRFFSTTSSTAGSTVSGNVIGLSAGGAALPNLYGVLIEGTSGNRVSNNRIWFNQQQGIDALAGNHNRFDANSIGENGALGIALAGSANDAQVAPVLTDATSDGVNTWFMGTLSTANPTAGRLSIELFTSASCDPSGSGEGESFAVARALPAPLGPQPTISFVVKVAGANAARIATATATSLDSSGTGDTSAFSACKSIRGCPVIALAPAGLPIGVVGVPYQQTLGASGGAGAYRFALSDGALPWMLTLGAGGLLSGTPAAPGSFAFSVTALDANGCPATQPYTLEIAPAGSDLAGYTFDLGVPSDLGAGGDDLGSGNGGHDLGAGKSGKGGCGCQIGARAADAGAPVFTVLALMLLLPPCWKRSRAASRTQKHD